MIPEYGSPYYRDPMASLPGYDPDQPLGPIRELLSQYMPQPTGDGSGNLRPVQFERPNLPIYDRPQDDFLTRQGPLFSEGGDAINPLNRPLATLDDIIREPLARARLGRSNILNNPPAWRNPQQGNNFRDFAGQLSGRVPMPSARLQSGLAGLPLGAASADQDSLAGALQNIDFSELFPGQRR